MKLLTSTNIGRIKQTFKNRIEFLNYAGAGFIPISAKSLLPRGTNKKNIECPTFDVGSWMFGIGFCTGGNQLVVGDKTNKKSHLGNPSGHHSLI